MKAEGTNSMKLQKILTLALHQIKFANCLLHNSKAAMNKDIARLVKRQLQNKRSQLVPHPELYREFKMEEREGTLTQVRLEKVDNIYPVPKKH